MKAITYETFISPLNAPFNNSRNSKVFFRKEVLSMAKNFCLCCLKGINNYWDKQSQKFA